MSWSEWVKGKPSWEKSNWNANDEKTFQWNFSTAIGNFSSILIWLIDSSRSWRWGEMQRNVSGAILSFRELHRNRLRVSRKFSNFEAFLGGIAVIEFLVKPEVSCSANRKSINAFPRSSRISKLLIVEQTDNKWMNLSKTFFYRSIHENFFFMIIFSLWLFWSNKRRISKRDLRAFVITWTTCCFPPTLTHRCDDFPWRTFWGERKTFFLCRKEKIPEKKKRLAVI